VPAVQEPVRGRLSNCEHTTQGVNRTQLQGHHDSPARRLLAFVMQGLEPLFHFPSVPAPLDESFLKG